MNLCEAMLSPFHHVASSLHQNLAGQRKHERHFGSVSDLRTLKNWITPACSCHSRIGAMVRRSIPLSKLFQDSSSRKSGLALEKHFGLSVSSFLAKAK